MLVPPASLADASRPTTPGTQNVVERLFPPPPFLAPRLATASQPLPGAAAAAVAAAWGKQAVEELPPPLPIRNAVARAVESPVVLKIRAARQDAKAEPDAHAAGADGADVSRRLRRGRLLTSPLSRLSATAAGDEGRIRPSEKEKQKRGQCSPPFAPVVFVHTPSSPRNTDPVRRRRTFSSSSVVRVL